MIPEYKPNLKDQMTPRPDETKTMNPRQDEQSDQ